MSDRTHATTDRRGPPRLDFDESPYIVIWETTRSCDLACIHCRAEAIPYRDPRELSTEEAFRLLSQVRDFSWRPGETVPAPGAKGPRPTWSPPVFVLTGGDPLKRPDIERIVQYGAWLGLKMSMTPSGTPLVTREALEGLAGAGLERLAVSLDASTAAAHDAFRKVSGSYDWTLNILDTARDIGLATQVNTTMTRFNLDDFEAIADVVRSLGVTLWSVFFLVPTGRGRHEDELDAEAYERVFARMAAVAEEGTFDVKSTAAPHYRRYLIQHRMALAVRGRGSRRGSPTSPSPPGGRDRIAPPGAPDPDATEGTGGEPGDRIGRSFKAVNDADGLVFISHTGDVYPSGFLPVLGGNVRKDSLVSLYRHGSLFRDLRDRSKLKGKCGICEYRHVCGGSRARAWASFGDLFESEPWCSYVPPAYQRMVEAGTALEPEAYFAERFARSPAPASPVSRRQAASPGKSLDIG